MLAPEARHLAKYFPALIQAARDILRDNLARIIVHGSAVRGGFNELSDIDIAVLVHEDSGVHAGSALQDAIPMDDMVRWQLSPHTESLASVERYRNFDLCYEGRVCAGYVIFDDGKPFEGVRLSRDEARREVIGHYLAQARQWLEEAKNAAALQVSDYARHEAARAACRALHALLIAHEQDPSPKTLRWNLRGLCGRARTLSPAFDIVPSRLLAEASGERVRSLMKTAWTARRTKELIAEANSIYDRCDAAAMRPGRKDD